MSEVKKPVAGAQGKPVKKSTKSGIPKKKPVKSKPRQTGSGGKSQKGKQPSNPVDAIRYEIFARKCLETVT